MLQYPGSQEKFSLLQKALYHQNLALEEALEECYMISE